MTNPYESPTPDDEHRFRWPTLIEILVAITLILVATAIALPALFGP